MNNRIIEFIHSNVELRKGVDIKLFIRAALAGSQPDGVIRLEIAKRGSRAHPVEIVFEQRVRLEDFAVTTTVKNLYEALGSKDHKPESKIERIVADTIAKDARVRILVHRDPEPDDEVMFDLMWGRCIRTAKVPWIEVSELFQYKA